LPAQARNLLAQRGRRARGQPTAQDLEGALERVEEQLPIHDGLNYINNRELAIGVVFGHSRKPRYDWPHGNPKIYPL
jgi:hypothetical protein